jgi:hypothetical protein
MDDEYEVGYGKPPKDSQFKKGQSGNKRGRPKGVKNLKTEVMEELTEMVKMRVGDRALRISKQRALLKLMWLKGMKGDSRSLNSLLGLLVRVLGLEGMPPDAEIKLTSEERDALELFKKQLREATSALAIEENIEDEENSL